MTTKSRPTRFTPTLRPLESRDVPATFTVTTLSDLPSNFSGSLREAIQKANITPGTDDIIFQAGLTGTITLAGSLPDITEAVRVTAAPGAVTLDGAKTYQILNVQNVARSVSITGLRFTGGVAANGGAISSAAGLALTNVTFDTNTAVTGGPGTGSGGALYFDGLNGGDRVALNNVTFTNNTAAVSGGAVAFNATEPTTVGIDASGAVTFTGNSAPDAGAVDLGPASLNGVYTFSKNAATAGSGGAVLAFNGSLQLAAGSVFDGNTAKVEGGAVLAHNASGTVAGATFTGNTAQNGGALASTLGAKVAVGTSTFDKNTASSSGGALYANAGDLTVTASKLTNNAGGNGGAIDIEGLSNFAMSNSVVANNSAGADGGGLYFGTQSSSPQLVQDTTFSGNNAGPNGSAGGAVFNRASGLVLQNVTITGNTAALGGGVATGGGGTVFVNSTVTGNTAADGGGVIVTNGGGNVLFNSIFVGNTATGPTGFADASDTSALNPFDTNYSIGGNVIGVTDPSTAKNFQASDATGVTPAAARLGTLQNNGGPVPTVGLLAGSPALGRGLASVTVTVPPPVSQTLSGTAPPTDARGVARPSGTIDAGAFQVRPATAVGQSFATNFNTPLTVAAPGLLTGATAGEPTLGQPVTLTGVSALTPPTAGTLTTNPNGSFTFTPAAGFSGPVTFTYQAADVRASAPVTATITVGQPPPPPVTTRVELFAAAEGAGGLPLVRTYRADGTFYREFLTMDGTFDGGVRVATGDVNGDGTDDLVVGAGPGGGPRVQVFDGATGNLLFNFFAYESTFSNGVFVALGDVTGDGRADVVVGAGSLGGPRVRALDGNGFGVVQDFFAYDPTFRGGVRVAVGDTDGDGRSDIVTSAGVSGAPHVRVLDGQTLAEKASFFAYDSTYRGGVFVSVLNDTDGGPGTVVTAPDSVPDFAGTVLESLFPTLPNVNGATAGRSPFAGELALPGEVRAFSVSGGQVTGRPGILPYGDSFLGGVRLAEGPAVNGTPTVVTAPGLGGTGVVRRFAVDPGGFVPLAGDFAPFPGFTGSVYVG